LNVLQSCTARFRGSLLGVLALSGIAVSAAALASAAVAGSKPDISGVWLVAPGSGALHPVDGGGEPPLLPAARALRDQFRAGLAKGDHSVDPTEKCKPPGNPRTMLEAMPFEILQRPDLLYFGYQWNRLNRFAYFSATLPPAPGWTFYGNSVVAWDGNTLVVRSHGYQHTGVTFLDATGLPHSDKQELTERYTLKSGGKQLQLRLRFEDSGSYARPWEAQVLFNRQTGVRIGDDVCVLRKHLIKTN
jgi:hypothetical protein